MNATSITIQFAGARSEVDTHADEEASFDWLRDSCRDCGQRSAGLAGITLSPAPAEAVVYCQYIDYPPSCVARAGVVLRPRPVARAATAGPRNLNGGVNRVGVRR